MQLGITQNSKGLIAKIQAINEQISEIIARSDKIHNEQDLELMYT